MKINKSIVIFLSSLTAMFFLTCGTRDKGNKPKAAELPESKERYKNMETATFGAGCFWGVQWKFQHVPGVVDTTTGYMGGTAENPTYSDVCSGKTGHAEVVRVIFDPVKISYAKLLDIFWSIHNPTTLNRQGVDVGSQYRSVVFYHTKEQEKTARGVQKKLEKSGKYHNKIITQIVPAGPFYPAEDYHQDYYGKNNSLRKLPSLPEFLAEMQRLIGSID